jgi:hypothetical protein
MRSNAPETTRFLLANTPCSHLHSFCGTGVSNGLAKRMTLTRASRGRLGESTARGWTSFCFDFAPHKVIVVGLRWKWCSLHFKMQDASCPVLKHNTVWGRCSLFWTSHLMKVTWWVSRSVHFTPNTQRTTGLMVPRLVTGSEGIWPLVAERVESR